MNNITRRKNDLMVTVCCSLLILLFGYAGVSKLLEFSLFRWQLQRSPLFEKMPTIIAVGLPLAEWGVCSLLLFDKTRLTGLYSSLLLLVLFTLYIVYLLNSDKRIPCSCGGVLRMLSWKQHIWFNLAFTAIPIIGIVRLKSDKI